MKGRLFSAHVLKHQVHTFCKNLEVIGWTFLNTLIFWRLYMSISVEKWYNFEDSLKMLFG